MYVITKSQTKLAFTSCWYLNIACCRVRTVVRDHVLYAALHEATAASISDVVVLGTRVRSSFVACQQNILIWSCQQQPAINQRTLLLNRYSNSNLLSTNVHNYSIGKATASRNIWNQVTNNKIVTLVLTIWIMRFLTRQNLPKCFDANFIAIRCLKQLLW